jgi:uncharacterized membrane protein (DUF4010 family)
MDGFAPFQVLGVALGLGLLVGLQRERDAPRLAGIRTFPLITLLGAVAGLLVEQLGGWIVGAAALGVVASVVARAIEGTTDRRDHEGGITTEIAIVLMFCVGVALALLPLSVGVVVGSATAVLLHAKTALHRFAQRLGERDVRAVMQFVLISLIILPVLPDTTFGPFNVLNARETWLMVVLVSGISFAGYVAYRVFGERAGTVLGGLIGGAISSTATTVSAARRSSRTTTAVTGAALMIMLASCVSFVRVLIEIGVVARGSLTSLGPPVVILLGVMATLSVGLWFFAHGHDGAAPPSENPTELKPAIIFGALYAAVLLGVAAAKHHFGNEGVYVIAVLSGLTDMDAITLSTARLVESGDVGTSTGWRVIVIASMANLAFKGAIAGALGSRRLLLLVGALFAAALLTGGALLLFWDG